MPDFPVPTPRPLHVLLIDDAVEEALLFTSALEHADLPVRLTVLESGPQALTWLEAGGDPPDLLLMDVNLPRDTGIEVLRRLKATPALHHLPVIMISTSDMGSQVQACYAAYASAFLVKPSSFPKLVEMLERLAGFWANPSVRLPGLNGTLARHLG